MSVHREIIIPKGDTPEVMPSGLCIQYLADAFGKEEKVTESSLNELVKRIAECQNLGVYLSQNPDLEEEYMEVEVDNGWISLMLSQHDGSRFYSSFDPAYLDSEEESPINCSDGQSIILKRYTMRNPHLAARCVEYYVRTGTLYPGMAWLKGWTE